jgi:O-methyltransferase domain
MLMSASVQVPEPVTTAPQPNSAEIVLQISTGYMASISMYIAAKLRIADLLAGGPRPVRELAAATSTNEDRLYRVLRLLASVGVFSESAPRVFSLNPVAEVLRSDIPNSMHPLALWMSDPFHFRTYAEIMHTMKTGEITCDHFYGKPCFEYLAGDPEESAVFNAAMTCLSEMVVPAVLEVYDFSDIRTLMDVAGGHGALLRAILNKYPGMRGMVMDLDHVIGSAKNVMDNQTLAHRCEFLVGDFFAAVPTGADAIIMKHIIHDWDDDKAALILRNCRNALGGKPGAKVILVESVLPEGNEPHFGKILDVEMFVLPGGRERTEKEFRALFEAAGLRLNRIVPTKAPLWVVEGVVA